MAIAATLVLVAGVARLSMEGRKSKLATGWESQGAQQTFPTAPRESDEEAEAEFSESEKMDLAGALAAYDAVKRTAPCTGELSSLRSAFLDHALGMGSLEAEDLCKLLDHALPDLEVNGEINPLPQIAELLDLAYSGRGGGGELDHAALDGVMAWIVGLKNPAVQCTFLNGAGQWYGKRMGGRDAMAVMQQIGTSGARDRFAAGYLGEALAQSPRPLEEYLDYAMLAGKGICVGGVAKELPDDTDYSALPDLMLKKSCPPEPAVMEGLLRMWYSRKPAEAATFAGAVPEALRESLTLAVASMVVDSMPTAVDLVERMPAGAAKDRWLAEALLSGQGYSETNARRLAGQIADPQKREEVLADLKAKWEKKLADPFAPSGP